MCSGRERNPRVKDSNVNKLKVTSQELGDTLGSFYALFTKY